VQDLEAIPLHASGAAQPTRLDMVANIQQIQAPTEVDHYQIRRKLDIYVRPATEDLGKSADVVRAVIAQQQIPAGISVTVRGSASAMSESFRSFTVGLMLPVLCRSVHYPACAATRDHWCTAGAGAHRDDHERDVFDGRGHACRHCHVQ
jgi:multidrug efflux pump subunit AcrB